MTGRNARRLTAVEIRGRVLLEGHRVRRVGLPEICSEDCWLLVYGDVMGSTPVKRNRTAGTINITHTQKTKRERERECVCVCVCVLVCVGGGEKKVERMHAL